MQKLLIAAVVAGIAATAPMAGSAADAGPRRDSAPRQHEAARPVIRFDEAGGRQAPVAGERGEREAHVASPPRSHRFVRPGWAARRPRWHARWRPRGIVGLPFHVLGWALSALPH